MQYQYRLYPVYKIPSEGDEQRVSGSLDKSVCSWLAVGIEPTFEGNQVLD